MDILSSLEFGKTILFVGLGSGFDIFGAIPLWVNLRNKNKKFVFVNCNLSVSKFMDLAATEEIIYPESHLKEVFVANEMDGAFYVVPKTGVKSQQLMFKTIIEKHEPDTVIGIDGGVDALMHGDEEGCGTIIEDFISLAVINNLPILKKYVACCGLGAEIEEKVCHHAVFENIAQLTAQGGFLGCSALVKKSDEYDVYKQICEYVWKKSKRKSHIHTRIISAVEGKFGNDNLYGDIGLNLVGQEIQNYILPLMSLYWFFDFDKVVANNKLVPLIEDSISSVDVTIIYKQFLSTVEKRERRDIPCF